MGVSYRAQRSSPARSVLGLPLTVFVVLFKTFDTLDRILLIHGGVWMP